MMAHGIILSTTVAAILSGCAQALPSKVSSKAHQETSPLRFNKNGTFQISVFNDLHFGEAENLNWGPGQDAKSLEVMNMVLDSESPDLVVINGDLITGENTYLHNSSHYVDEIVKPLVSRNLLWASTYGNHDSQFNLSRASILEREHLWSNSLTANMVPTSNDVAGVTNYYIPVYSSDTREENPILILWFFDSRGGFLYQQSSSNGSTVPQDEWVHENVVDWFTATNARLQAAYGHTIPSLAFYHIPTNAMLSFQQTHPGVSNTTEPGINDDNPLAQQGISTTGEYIGTDIPFMRALLSTEGLLATFSGHDHGDDWCMKWNSSFTVPSPSSSDSNSNSTPLTGNGLNLCFARHTGYGGYGSWTRGSRQIILDEHLIKTAIHYKSRLRHGLHQKPTTIITSTPISTNNDNNKDNNLTDDDDHDDESWPDLGLVYTYNRLEDRTVSGAVTLNKTYGLDRYPVVPDGHTSCGC